MLVLLLWCRRWCSTSLLEQLDVLLSDSRRQALSSFWIIITKRHSNVHRYQHANRFHAASRSAWRTLRQRKPCMRLHGWLVCHGYAACEVRSGFFCCTAMPPQQVQSNDRYSKGNEPERHLCAAGRPAEVRGGRRLQHAERPALEILCSASAGIQLCPPGGARQQRGVGRLQLQRVSCGAMLKRRPPLVKLAVCRPHNH